MINGKPGPDGARRNGVLSRCMHPIVRILATGGMVLGYHGLRRPDELGDGGMHVPASTFASTVAVLRAVATYVPLSELLHRHRTGRGTRGLVAVTFDDAYASIVDGAWAVVREHSVPVTVFAISGAASTGRPFWWDRIDDSFAVASARRWRSFEDECGLPDAFRTGQPARHGRIRPLRQWVLAEHRGRWPVSLEEPLARLEADTGCRPTQRPLTFEELDRLAADPLVDIGSHSVSHPVLPLLSDDEIRREIRVSYRGLRDRYPRTLSVLAPPFGLYDERTLRIGTEEGLTNCLTLEAKLLDDGAPRDVIPRVCMTAGHRAWQSVLFALGCWRGIRPRRVAIPGYPDLPSAST